MGYFLPSFGLEKLKSFVVAGWIHELVSCFYSYCMFVMLNMLGDAQVKSLAVHKLNKLHCIALHYIKA